MVADVALDLPPGVSALGVTTVRVTVSMRPQIGTRSFQVGIELRNADPAVRYDLGAGQVIVTIGGPLASLNLLNGATLVATVDVAGLSPGPHALVADVQVPFDLTVAGLSPPEVTVTVTPLTPATPTPVPSVVP